VSTDVDEPSVSIDVDKFCGLNECVDEVARARRMSPSQIGVDHGVGLAALGLLAGDGWLVRTQSKQSKPAPQKGTTKLQKPTVDHCHRRNPWRHASGAADPKHIEDRAPNLPPPRPAGRGGDAG
jgi:hypothetical protein